MGRDAERAVVEDAGALWERVKWLRLSIGGEWPPGGHVRAQNEWLRLDRQAIRDEQKIARLRTWIIGTGWTSVEAIDDGIERLARTARRFGGSQAPVERLRVVARDDELR